MAAFTKAAIVARAESDARLRSILALDPHLHAGGRPAIFSAWRSHSPDALPQLIIMQAGDDDTDMVDQATGVGGVWKERFHFEAWAKTEDDVPQQIMEIIKELFHNARFALSGATFLYMQMVGGDPEGFDQETEESFSTEVYELAYSR